MAAVASLLDSTHAALVRGVWADLQESLGVSGMEISPLPHITYIAARDFDVERLTGIVEQLARGSRRLKVHSAGLGIFPGSPATVYVPLVRTPELTRFQLAVWSAAMAFADAPIGHYHPAEWIPHITLAVGVVPERLGEVVCFLNERTFEWTLDVETVCVIAGAGHKPQELVANYDLGPPARNF